MRSELIEGNVRGRRHVGGPFDLLSLFARATVYSRFSGPLYISALGFISDPILGRRA